VSNASKWVVLCDDGLLEQFTEFTVPGVIRTPTAFMGIA